MITRYYYKKNIGKELLNITMPIEDYALLNGIDATEYTQITEEEYNAILDEWKSESGSAGGIKASTIELDEVISVANNGTADNVQSALQYLSSFTSQTDQNLQEMDRMVDDLYGDNKKRIDDLDQMVNENHEERIVALEDLTVDKIDEIDSDVWGASEIEIHEDSGIIWHDRAELYDENGRSMGAFHIIKHVPIVAGNKITFEVDEENQTVKINSTASGGGGGASVASEVALDDTITVVGNDTTNVYSALYTLSSFANQANSDFMLLASIVGSHEENINGIRQSISELQQTVDDNYDEHEGRLDTLRRDLTVLDQTVDDDCVKREDMDELVLNIMSGENGEINEERQARIREFLGISIYDGEVVDE